jgi:hypothetical protein
MSHTLYYTVQFVALHQKNPGYDVFSNAGNPYLDINGVATSQRQYGTEFGFGDPGENPAYDTVDYTEWSIGFSTFVKPATYSTATATYQSELPGGATATNTYRIWHVVSVPDTFLLPAEYLTPSSAKYVKAFLDSERKTLISYLKESDHVSLSVLGEAAGLLNTPYNLYDKLKTHLEAQFDIITRGLSGSITPEQMMQLSDNAATSLVIGLAGQATGANASSLLAAAAKQIVADRLIG